MGATFDLEAIRKILHAHTEEMYIMERGVFIARPEEKIRFGDAILSRKQTKHIVEHRKSEGKTIADIKEVFDHLPQTVIDPDFEVPNLNPKYPESVVRVKVFAEWERSVVVVLDKKNNGTRDVITAYVCSPKHAYLLKKKRLYTSAAGETPHS